MFAFVAKSKIICMEAHVVYILSLLSLFIHHQSLVAKERLEIKNHFIRSGYFQILFTS